MVEVPCLEHVMLTNWCVHSIDFRRFVWLYELVFESLLKSARVIKEYDSATSARLTSARFASVWQTAGS